MNIEGTRTGAGPDIGRSIDGSTETNGGTGMATGATSANSMTSATSASSATTEPPGSPGPSTTAAPAPVLAGVPGQGSGLRLEEVTVGYGRRAVLEELSLEIPAGRFTAVIGPNGCGKSTMLKALARTLPLSSGQVVLDGAPLGTQRSRSIARRLAMLPQEPVVPDGITVRGLVDRGRHPYRSALRRRLPGDGEAVDSAMAATGITELADSLVTELSGGQRQRVWIAMVLAQQTAHVLLDEPTSFLDIAHQIEILHLCQDMRENGRTVLAVLHDLNQAARFADELVVLHEGRLVAQGPPEHVIDEELLVEVFDLDAEVARDPQSGSPMVVPRRRAGSHGLAERRS